MQKLFPAFLCKWGDLTLIILGLVNKEGFGMDKRGYAIGIFKGRS